jgi:putative transposase
VHKQRLLRLMPEHHLLVSPNVKLKAKRTPIWSKPKATTPNEWWGIDMTKVLAEGFGWVCWVYFVVVLAWYTKTIVGYQASLQCRAQPWLAALDMAVNRQFPDGVREQGLALMRDNGCQPTAVAFMQAYSTLGFIRALQAITSPRAMPTPSA